MIVVHQSILLYLLSVNNVICSVELSHIDVFLQKSEKTLAIQSGSMEAVKVTWHSAAACSFASRGTVMGHLCSFNMKALQSMFKLWDRKSIPPYAMSPPNNHIRSFDEGDEDLFLSKRTWFCHMALPVWTSCYENGPTWRTLRRAK